MDGDVVNHLMDLLLEGDASGLQYHVLPVIAALATHPFARS